MKLLVLHENKSSLISDLQKVPGLDRVNVSVEETSSLADMIARLAKSNDVNLIVISIAAAQSKAARWNALLISQGVQVPIVFVPDTNNLTAIAGAVLDRLVLVPVCNATGRKALATLVSGISAQLAQSATKSAAVSSTSSDDRMPKLTKRQRQVLELILKGMSNKDIARELKLAEGTIKIHSIAIYRELGVANRTQAALRASQLFAA